MCTFGVTLMREPLLLVYICSYEPVVLLNAVLTWVYLARVREGTVPQNAELGVVGT